MNPAMSSPPARPARRYALAGKPLEGRALVTAMCVGQLGNLLPHVTLPAIMPAHLMPLWGLSAAHAGLMASAYAIGYALAVPVLTALTDRFDARPILLAGSMVTGLATLAFGVFADGLVSASLWWGLAGVGFGGAYMPGLKALTDRLPPGDSSRSVTLYTACFSVGVGLSFLVSQIVADLWGWRASFFVTGVGPLAMAAVCLKLAPFTPDRKPGNPLDFRPVLRNRAALGYILGYGAHCFELAGMRTWIVAFWTFVVAYNRDSWLSPIAVSVIVTLLSLPASIGGNEAALRFGRHRAIAVIMIASASLALAIGLSAAAFPLLLLPLVLLYGITVPADSGALTSGMSMNAVPVQRGATMALHSTIGVGLSALGASVTGVALDLSGGPATASGWFAMFAVMAAGTLLGPLALWWSSRR
jgi:predicted MFS family arabinose efflux permease